MRLGVVSDIHGNLPALQAVVADAGRVSAWLNLGDILSGPLWPVETADWLMARHWPTLAGNHERQLLHPDLARMGASDRYAAERLRPEQRAWLQALPTQLQPLADVLCVHGTPAKDYVCLMETITEAGLRAATADEIAPRIEGVAAALLLCGHSHLPRDVQVGATRVVNPGSVGLPAYDHDWPQPHVVENGSPHARYAVIEKTRQGWQVELRAVAYDWEAAARRAEDNGRVDWADALRTGTVGRTMAG